MKGFEDLLPPEVGSRRPGPAPMRPAGVTPPPAVAPQQAQAPLPAAEAPPPPPSPPCPVDGVPDSVVDAWFAEADADHDGRVADSEARAFFLTSGLAPADLSKIWKLVKSPEVIAREGKGLTRYRFAQVLRLIALAQSGVQPFSQENASAALHATSWLALHGAPLPPPRIGAASQQQPQQLPGPFGDNTGSSVAAQQQSAAPATATQVPAAAGTSDDLLGGADLLLPVAPVAGAPAAPPAAAASCNDDDDDLFGLKALQARAALHGATTSSGAAAAGAAGEEEGGGGGLERRLSRSNGVSSRDSRKGGIVRVHSSPLEPPVAFEARLPPLQPKASAKLTMLAAANGSLFAGPSVGGGLLQWGRPEGNLRRPLDVEGEHVKKGKLGRLMSDLMYTHSGEGGQQTAPGEDPDAAPSIEVPATDKGRPASCTLVDEGAALLWVADKEGWVYAYDVSGEPCMSLRTSHRLYQFQAQRVGYVTALLRAPTGELWTGSSRGNIRVWELGEPALAGDAPEPPRCRELRKAFGERAHNGPVVSLLCPADGQLVWSASSKGLLLWDAACGAFLGALQRSGTALSGSMSARLGSQSLPGDPLGGAADASRFTVVGSKGLETDPITGYVVARPGSSDWPRLAADQEAWAAQTDNNINELMERVSIGGSKVVQGAGKAVKLLGKLLGGGAAPPADAPKPAAGRQPSANAMMAPAASLDEDSSVSASEASGGVVQLLAPPDGSVWVAHKCGTVDRYSAAGRRLGSAECGAALTAAACVGQRVWLGFSDGMISVRDASCTCLKVFQAHGAGLLSIVQAGSRTYSLAADGSISGWSSAVPHPTDLYALASWDEQARNTYRRESLRCLCVTWNVGESKPDSGSSFFRWVHEAAFNCQLAVVGLQEIEMGSSSVALAAAKDAFNTRMQERGNANAKFWGGGVLAALGGERHWHQVGLRQLSGMLIAVYARNHLKDAIGEVATASVACGVLGVGGNKGAVAVEFSVHRRRIAVLCSHFAAHQGAVEARNANYATICRQLTFNRRAWLADEADVGVASPVPSAAISMPRGKGASTAIEDILAASAAADDSDADSIGPDATPLPPSAVTLPGEELSLAGGESMRGAHMLVWLGDFNYRIDGAYEAVREAAIRNELGALLELDQCRREMAAGRVFRGLREGPLTFRPTYKFDKAAANPFAYDSSEKRRTPAWCDRVFFRGSVPFSTPEPEEGEEDGVLDEEGDVSVAALDYGCWADVTDSDHKPVYAVLEANLPITDQAKKRGVCSQLLKDCAAAAAAGEDVAQPPMPAAGAEPSSGGDTSRGDGGSGSEQGAAAAAASLQPRAVRLHPSAMPRQLVLLRNEGPRPLLFSVTCEGAVGSGGSGAGPFGDADAPTAAHRLLEVRPQRGVVPPGADCPLQVHLAGDEWSLRGLHKPPEVRYRVTVGGEYSVGGEAIGAGAAHLDFTATCLIDL